MSLPSLIQMMSQLIATPSISCSQASWDQSNKAVITLLESWLTQLGFRCEVLPIANQKDKFNLIATLGEGTGGLVLSGHTDTVPYDQGRWQSDPFKLTEREQKLYGLGSCDMKGFFAIALDAIKSMADVPFEEPLIILATADEESSMSGARALVEAGLPKARYALIGEPTSLTPIYAHKGIMMERIEVRGKSGHSSNPKLGVNALDTMHTVISDLMQFRQELKNEYSNTDFLIDYPTMNLGCIHGGDNPNRICGHCDLEFDIRTLPGMDDDHLIQAIQTRLANIADQTGTQIEFNRLFPAVPAFATSRNSDIVKACEQLTNKSAQTVAFATEGAFLNQLGMETLVLGPGSIDQAHQPNEFIALDQIEPMQNVIRSLVKRYCLNE
ncbi:acetylornithine deacetylase [Marinomonas agarivorans]|nr:acetylornithine deacetylase [Marinomonas agarivorans]